MVNTAPSQSQFHDAGRWPPSHRRLITSKLEALATAAGIEHMLPNALAALDVLAMPWLDWPANGRTPWASDLTDDGTPLEFSISYDSQTPALRLLTESQGPGRDPASSWSNGLEVNRRLASDFGADLEAFECVSPLFTPASEDSGFAMWHGAVLQADGPPAFKVYLNPRRHGPEQARSVVDEALQRLKLTSAQRLVRELPVEWATFYFSLDLGSALGGRAKVYLCSPSSTPASLAAELDALGLAPAAEVESWLARLLRDRSPLESRPIQMCLAFRSGRDLPELTLHVPVRSYVSHDAEALHLACQWLRPHDAAALTAGVQAMAQRPLESGRSLISYVSLRPRPDHLGVTVYLSPQLYAVPPPRCVSLDNSVKSSSYVRELGPKARGGSTRTLRALTDEIARCKERLSRKPFLRRVRHEGTLAEAKGVVRRMAFWVMGFQDILRLVTRFTTEPTLTRLACTHEAEDRGHDHWFLHDLEQLGLAVSLSDAFGDDSEVARDTVYGLIADVVKAEDDRARLCVVLSLEAAGVEYFAATIAFLQRVGVGDGLLYYARSHQTVEANHDVFEEDKQAELAAMPVSETAFEECLRVIHRTFRAMEVLGEELYGWLEPEVEGAGDAS